MLTEAGKSVNNNDLDISSDKSDSRERKNIEAFSIIALFCLIAALLLISFDQRLFGGCLIIAGASLGLVTVRKASRFSRRLEESLLNISSSNERKDDVIKKFSHKIRGPLNSLVLIVDMITDSDLRKKNMELFDSLTESTNNMVATVNELTMQSAENMGHEHRKAIRFNLLSTIENTIELYKLKDNVNISFNLNEEEFNNFECVGDPIILNQIFLSLFDTIEKNTTSGSTQVTINLSKTELTRTESLISLKTQTDRPIVLVDDSIAEHGLISELITSAKGSFSQQLKDNSSVLTIFLPFTNPVLEQKKDSTSSKIIELREKDKVQKKLNDIKILLVEDNLINKNITLLTLKPLVNSIESASNGKEALDMFGANSYDLILMDIQMPVMNGLIAAEKIRALESTTNTHIPIIAITANAMIGDKEKCLSVGIDDYISKPFQPVVLIEKIKKYFS
jgi:CheY-like chemotaxis protein